jgi:hypothetical protein
MLTKLMKHNWIIMSSQWMVHWWVLVHIILWVQRSKIFDSPQYGIWISNKLCWFESSEDSRAVSLYSQLQGVSH